MNKGTVPMDGSQAGIASTFEDMKLKFREGEGEPTLKTLLVQCLSGEKQYSI